MLDSHSWQTAKLKAPAMATRKCKLPWCRNKTGSWVSFHRFPEQIDRKAEWCKRIGIDPLLVFKNSSICSEHFEPNQFTSRNKIQVKKNAVPYVTNPGIMIEMKELKLSGKSPLASSSEPLKSAVPILPLPSNSSLSISRPVLTSTDTWMIPIQFQQPNIPASIAQSGRTKLGDVTKLLFKPQPEPTTFEAALDALKLSETRLSAALHWIQRFHGQFPASLRADLGCTEQIDRNSNISTSNFASRRASSPKSRTPLDTHLTHLNIKTQTDEIISEPISPEPELLDDHDGFLDTEVPTPTQLRSNQQNFRSKASPKTHGPIKIVDIRTILSRPTTNLDGGSGDNPNLVSNNALRCRYCPATFESEPALSVHSLIHMKLCLQRLDIPNPKQSCKLLRRGRRYCIRLRQNNMTVVRRTHAVTSRVLQRKGKDQHTLTKPVKCELCPRVFRSDIHMKNHLERKHRRPKACELCNMQFSTTIERTVHIRTEHPQLACYKCDKCGKGFLLKEILVNHIKFVHAGLTYATNCDVCGKLYKNTKNLKNHMRIQHLDPRSVLRYATERRQKPCELCPRSFTLELHLRNHIERVHRLPRSCEACNMQFKTFKDRTSHFRTLHPELCHKCDRCEKKFITKSELKIHLSCHSDQNHACKACGKLYRSSSGLTRHIKSQHSESNKAIKCEVAGKRHSNTRTVKPTVHPDTSQTTTCKVCGKRYDNNRNLKRHTMLVHPDSNHAVTCEVCGKIYGNSKYLKRHIMMVHPDPNQAITCQVCGKIYKNTQILKRHIRKVHPDPSDSVTCPTCGGKYRNTEDLRKHMKSHGPRSFLCQICGYTAKTSGQLSIHTRRVHILTKSYKCPHCPCSFKTSEILDRHVDRHLGRNMKTCPHCGLKRHAIDMYQHIRLVHKGKKFKCSHCPGMYSSRAYLKNHYIENHPGVTIPQDADIEIIYTKKPEDTSSPLPTRRNRLPQGQVSSRACLELSCSTCPDTVFYYRKAWERHMARHDKDPSFKIMKPHPVTRVEQEIVEIDTSQQPAFPGQHHPEMEFVSPSDTGIEVVNTDQQNSDLNQFHQPQSRDSELGNHELSTYYIQL